MKIENHASFVENVLTRSFVEDYRINKKLVEKINKELHKSNIPFEYSYDEFCAEFLEKTLQNIDYRNLFAVNSINLIYTKFSKYNKKTKQHMFTLKFITYCII